ncbi:MAG: HNH endonuclease [Nitrospirae bacterium]|nr:HNH endonuclease [Nitrospirota bacterium]
MKFELNLKRYNIPETELIADMKRVCEERGTNTVTVIAYKQFGHFSPDCIAKRFGSWSKALKVAGLKENPSQRKNIPEEALFENLREVWISLARQPRYEEMKPPLSNYSTGTYERRFGTWNKALMAFMSYIDKGQTDSLVSDTITNDEPDDITKPRKVRRTKREISPRLRFSILLRDGFRCQSCGRSPIKIPGIDLHVDHILPWSQGGETVPDNLQTKCQTCNLGKGNAFNQ